MTFNETVKAIRPRDVSVGQIARERLNQLTKPLGSLGRLEQLAVDYVSMIGKARPDIPRPVIYTLAADHGIAQEPISAYPSSVTEQMVHNFLRGGAAINVLAAHAGADIRIVDMGVNCHFGNLPGLIERKVAKGTKNFLHEPAMSEAQVYQAIECGIELAESASQEGYSLIGLGEMGIGNTTSSAAITAVLTGREAHEVTGRGTGLDEKRWRQKVAVIEEAVKKRKVTAGHPIDLLAQVGGFEIAGLTGLILGGAARRIPVVLDGFITGAAALVAAKLAPVSMDFVFPSHQSAEPGHQILLAHLGLQPLLHLELRLGEGTGACLGIGLIQAAMKLYSQMATFGEAGVSEKTS